jgi:crossover junction endodeoxyribonuclease RuvC
MDEKIILGIDPGTTLMGYGLIKVVNNKMVFFTSKRIKSF